jgi:hypothetical protein
VNSGPRSGEAPTPDDEGRPPFDVDMATRLIGKHVLIGLTYKDTGGKVIRQEQKHGSVEFVDKKNGIGIRLSDGDLYWLPPDLRSWKPAVPGQYRLRSTGEVVVDPDYLTTWIVNAGK